MVQFSNTDNIREVEDRIMSSISVSRILASIPKKQKVILALKLAGYNQQAIAAILGLSRASVGTTLSRTIRQIQSYLSKE